MDGLRHLVFLLVYLSIAIAVAVTTPVTVPGQQPIDGIVHGALIFLAGALLHDVWSRRTERQRQQRRSRDLLNRLDIVDQRLNDLVIRAGQSTGGEIGAALSEARMLQSLATRLPATAVAPPPPESLITPLSADEAMLEQIRAALRQDRIDIFLQPVVSLPQRKHRYYEVFSRIRATDGTHLMPEQYLSLAAGAGLIAAIDNMLLFRCVQLIRESEKRPQTVGFFCNISAATLNDAGFMQEFVQFMGQHPNLVSRLVFELGQRELMEGGVFVTGFLDGLRRLGFRFSMDQVETLDIDWDQMARHEIRYVKLDTARLLKPDGPNPGRIRDLKLLLDRHEIDLIAEKVETDQQLEQLLDLYIDYGQGFLFGEPRPARRAEG